jgi:glycosyltransferase involved in cell wall biosynthesis
MAASISVPIITFNEEKNIAACLESIRWVDEIIILDCGSEDNTLSIAKTYGAKIYQQTWLGFGPQKNKALSYCTSDWILSLDADEVVTPALARSIKKVLATEKTHVYQIRRYSFFLGQLMKHGDWGRDWIVRLFKRGHYFWTNAMVHESIDVSKRTAPKLTGDLLHYTQNTLATALKKMNLYSSESATMMYAKGKHSSLSKLLLHKNWAFLRSYLLRLGFLDGKNGFILAKLIAYNSFFKHLKLIEKQLTRNE